MVKEHNLDKHKWQSHKCARLTGVTGKANTARRLNVARVYQPHNLVCRQLLVFLIEQFFLFWRTVAFLFGMSSVHSLV